MPQRLLAASWAVMVFRGDEVVHHDLPHCAGLPTSGPGRAPAWPMVTPCINTGLVWSRI